MENSPNSRVSRLSAEFSNHARQMLYKRTTPPWKEVQRMRLRERMCAGRQRLLTRLRGTGSASDSMHESADDTSIADMERLQQEMIAEETDFLVDSLMASGFTVCDNESESFTSVTEFVIRNSLLCPVCQCRPADVCHSHVDDQTGRANSGSRRRGRTYMVCPCGVKVRVGNGETGTDTGGSSKDDALWVRCRLVMAVEVHVSACPATSNSPHNCVLTGCAPATSGSDVCSDNEIFFSQNGEDLVMFCAACGATSRPLVEP